jgi:hypothetical protein
VAEGEAKGGRRFGTAAAALLTALLALVSSGIGLTFDLFPDLRPDPRKKRLADMEVLVVEQAVKRDEWLHRIAGPETSYEELRADYAKDELRERGTIAYVKTSVQGLKRDRVTLRWSMYRRASGRRFTEQPGFVDVEAAGVKLEAPTDAAVTQVWAPRPLGDGRFFLRFELRDRDGSTLAIADSKPFAGLL